MSVPWKHWKEKWLKREKMIPDTISIILLALVAVLAWRLFILQDRIRNCLDSQEYCQIRLMQLKEPLQNTTRLAYLAVFGAFVLAYMLCFN